MDPRASAADPLSTSALLDAFDDGVAVVDADGTIVVANAALAQLFGRPPGSLTGLNVDSLVPPEYRGAHARDREAFLRDGRPRAMDETGRDVVGVSAEGERVAVDVQLTPLGGGRTLAVVRDARRDRERAAELALARTDRDVWRASSDRRGAAMDDVVQHLFGTMATLEACRPSLQGEVAARVDRCLEALRVALAIAAVHV